MTDSQRVAMQAALEALEWGANAPFVTDVHTVKVLLRAALAEQDAEPVAWGWFKGGEIYDCISPGEHKHEPWKYTVALYTAPPRRNWIGLTRDEVADIALDCYAANGARFDDFALAAAIEAALKGKNGGGK